MLIFLKHSVVSLGVIFKNIFHHQANCYKIWVLSGAFGFECQALTQIIFHCPDAHGAGMQRLTKGDL